MATLALVLGAISASPAAKAQQINEKARQKATWYNAPREIQIIDERPMIRDFREAPVAPGMIQLPPGPQGFGGAGGGGGGGAMPDGGGGMPVLPGSGMPIGDSGPGYRTPIDPMGSLPKSGFGRDTNIPARGMGPKGPLPGGFTTGIHGQVMPFAKASSPAMGAGNRGAARPSRPVASAPAASYGGNYTSPSTSSGVGGMGASTAVRGALLTRLKGHN